ncbi:hypothetical protein ACFO25_10700 [Paenactinomyces guangxiensis]|nr:hypothetical protein [Paenactinomyces guangxiensis]
MFRAIRFCCFDPGCEGSCKETKDGVVYCPECGHEDYSKMK